MNTLNSQTVDGAPLMVPDSSLEWTEPQEIRTELLQVRKFPDDALPAPLKPLVIDIAYRMQCPIDFIATAVIVMFGSIVGASCGIKPKQKDDWLVVPNLWGGIVARPGKLKTPAIAEAFKPLQRLEALARVEHNNSNAVHEADLQAYEIQKSAIKDRMKTASKSAKGKPDSMDALKAELTALQQPQAPKARRYLVNDGTTEKIGEIERDNERGICVLRDELTGLFASLDREGREADRACYLEGWNGTGSFIQDRIARGTIFIKHHCLSLFGGIQPAKLFGYLHGSIKGSQNDGLVQRLQLLVYPDDIADWQLVDQIPDSNAKERVFKIAEQLAEMEFTDYGALQGDHDSMPFYRFDTVAQERFFGWLRSLEQGKLRADDHPIILEHLSKYRSLLPSLALIFHLIEIGDGKCPSQVSAQNVDMATAWCDYLETHARRIYGQVIGMSRRAAATLAERLRKRSIEDGFSVRDVCQKDWMYLSDRDVVAEACEVLIEAGWLRAERSPNGGRPTLRFTINPKIFKT